MSYAHYESGSSNQVLDERAQAYVAHQLTASLLRSVAASARAAHMPNIHAAGLQEPALRYMIDEAARCTIARAIIEKLRPVAHGFACGSYRLQRRHTRERTFADSFLLTEELLDATTHIVVNNHVQIEPSPTASPDDETNR
jgi:hypothetical protein